MKIIYLITTVLLVSIIGTLSAQVPSWEWARSTGGPAGANIGNGFAIDKYGNYYISGVIGSGFMTFGNDTLTNTSGSSNLFISKYDPSGNAIWAKELNTETNFNYISSITTDSNGDLCAIGFFQTQFIVIDSDTLFGVPNYENIFIIKLDISGNVLWSHTTVISAGSIAICSDMQNSIYITGSFGGDYTVFGADTIYNIDSSGGMSTFLVKYNASGNVIWAKAFEQASFYAICADKQGNIYCAGSTQEYGFLWGNDTLHPIGIENIFTAKIDSSGNPIWGKSAGGREREMGNSINIDVNGNVYIAGSYSSPVFIFGNDTIFQHRTSFGFNIVFMKYDSLGNEQWVKTPGGNYEDQASSVTIDASGNIFLIGRFDTDTLIFGNDTITNPNGDWDIFIAKYDPQGSTIWVKTTGGVGNLVPTASSYLNGSLYVAGWNSCRSIGFDLDTITDDSVNTDSQNIFVAKLGEYPTGITPIAPSSPITVYPNPSTGSFNFTGLTQGSSIEVYDVLGQEITSPPALSKGEGGTASTCVVNLSGRPAGVYFYRVTDLGISIGEGKVVLE